MNTEEEEEEESIRVLTSGEVRAGQPIELAKIHRIGLRSCRCGRGELSEQTNKTKQKKEEIHTYSEGTLESKTRWEGSPWH